MKGVQILGWIVIAIMTANMVNVTLNSGMDHGVGFDTFLAGSGDPWQLFINNDLVMGLLFIAGWMIFREQGSSVWTIVAWVWMLMWWGNIIAAVYVLRATQQSGGDWRKFFLGKREGALVEKPLSAPVRLLAFAGAAATAIYLVVSLQAVGFAPIPTAGYVLGFLPIVLSLALIGKPARAAKATA